MKKRIVWLRRVIGLILAVLGAGAVFFFTQYTVLHLPPKVSGIMLDGATPDEFCETEGKDTWLEGKYASATVDKDGCLILVLRKKVAAEWKNSFYPVQVLQCVLGDTRDIGVKVDYSDDYLEFLKDAHTCGFEISKDYTQIVESPEDNGWYYPLIVPACIEMQVFMGKTCDEIIVEYWEVDENGETLDHIVAYPQSDSDIADSKE